MSSCLWRVVVGMALFVNNVDRCLKVAEIAKSVSPRTKVVMGGPQATIFPEPSTAAFRKWNPAGR